jgi:hypothetical protein
MKRTSKEVTDENQGIPYSKLAKDEGDHNMTYTTNTQVSKDGNMINDNHVEQI